MSHTPHNLQYYPLVLGNPNENDFVLSLLLLGFRDFLTHTCCSPLLSQNSYRGHSSLKMSQGSYTTLHRDPSTQGSEGAWEEPGKHLSPSSVRVPTQIPPDKTNMAFIS